MEISGEFKFKGDSKIGGKKRKGEGGDGGRKDKGRRRRGKVGNQSVGRMKGVKDGVRSESKSARAVKTF